MAGSFEEVARELLCGPLETFTARRKEAAKQLDGELKDRVGKLAKPSQSAWALDAFAHARGPEIDALLLTGGQLREAQTSGDASRVRGLMSDANDQVRGLVRSVAGYAEELGLALGDAAQSQVEQTLRAAMADTEAANAVCAGLLVKALEPGGFGAVDLAGAVAGSPPTHRPSPGRAAKASRAEDSDEAAQLDEQEEAAARERARAEEERRRARLAAEKEKARAGKALDEAAQRLRQATRRLEEARREAESASDSVEHATRELESAERRLSELD